MLVHARSDSLMPSEPKNRNESGLNEAIDTHAKRPEIVGLKKRTSEMILHWRGGE
jgi:hypothetical protein